MSISKTGILLVNLGTPDAPTPWGVIKFLRAFLSDKRVVEYPRWLWLFILYGIVLPLRAIKIAKHYQKIWTNQGSPLRTLTTQLSKRLALYLSQQKGYDVPVVCAMTYGTPSLKEGLSSIKAMNVSRLIVLPLFPYYSATTTAAVMDALARQLAKERSIPSLFFIHEYGLEEHYLAALAKSIECYWQAHGLPERLLFSFHGLPERSLSLGDPYAFRCVTAVERLAKKLNIAENFFSIGFQSRFGFRAWLAPSTNEQLVNWAQEGIQSVDIVSPSFAVECLETLEELEAQSRSLFLKAGGKNFRYIPAMNDSEDHVRAIGRLFDNFF